MTLEVVHTTHNFAPIPVRAGDTLTVHYTDSNGETQKVAQHDFTESMTIDRAVIAKIENEHGFKKAIGAFLGQTAIVKGARVRVKMTAGFHKGAVGTVEFVEPASGKVWVIRDHAGSALWWHEDELEVIQDA